MKTILKTAALFACLMEGLAILFVVTGGSRVINDIVVSTWYGMIGALFLWPGVLLGHNVSGDSMRLAVTIGVSVLLWFIIWGLILGLAEKVKKGTATNLLRSVLTVSKKHGITPAFLVVIWMWLLPELLTSESLQTLLPRGLIFSFALLVLCLFLMWYFSQVELGSRSGEKILRNFVVSTVVIWLIAFYLYS